MPSPKREDGELPASPPRGGADAEMKDREPSPRKPDAADAEDGPSKRKNGGGGGDDDGTDKPPAAEPKRRRIDDGKRSARMFGNILGTLRKFQDDEGKTKKSEAAQRRAATQSRIAARLQTEAVQSSALLAAERELRAVQGALAADSFADRQLAAEARHALLDAAKGYLSTTPTPPLSRAGLASGPKAGPSRHPSRRDQAPATEQLYPGDLLPSAAPATSKGLSALYFLPRVLTPEQEDTLRRQERDVAELIEREKAAIDGEREGHAETRAAQEKKLRELKARVEELRAAEREKNAGQAMDVEA